MRVSLPIASHRFCLCSYPRRSSDMSSSNCSGSVRPRKTSILRDYLINRQKSPTSAISIHLMVLERWSVSRIDMRSSASWASLIYSTIPSIIFSYSSFKSSTMTWSFSFSGLNVFFRELISLRTWMVYIYSLELETITFDIEVHWPCFLSRYSRIYILWFIWKSRSILSIWSSSIVISTRFKSPTSIVVLLNRSIKDFYSLVSELIMAFFASFFLT